nr:conjugal transfer protein [Serratia proteamaculans]
MNTVKIIAVALGLTLISAMPAQAKDPCKAVLCLAGMLTGDDGGSECKSAVNE